MSEKHLQLVRSKELVDGKPKLPTSEQIMEGELAVNFAKGHETISMKNDEGEIVAFTPQGNEVEIGSGEPVDKTVDLFVDESQDALEVDIYDKNEIDSKVAELEKKIDEAAEKSVPEVEVGEDTPKGGDSILLFVDESQDALEVDLYTKSEIDGKVAELEGKIEEAAEKSVPEVEVGSGAPKEGDSILLFVDEAAEGAEEIGIYTKEEVDGKIGEVNSKIDAKVVVGDTAPTATDSTLFVDESEDKEVEVYSKAEVDALIAGLMAIIEKLKADNNLK